MRSSQSLGAPRKDPLAVTVSGLSSDAHTWNLVFVQLVLEELGHDVINVGACVPDAELVTRCRTTQPDLIVLSSVNGHGLTDGLRVIAALRESPALVATPVVIGGKLDTIGGDQASAVRLLAAGFDAVFPEGVALGAFREFVSSVASAASYLPPVTSPVGA